jgi:hypothetical protein
MFRLPEQQTPKLLPSLCVSVFVLVVNATRDDGPISMIRYPHLTERSVAAPAPQREPEQTTQPPLILTGPAVARKALREVPHRFAASGLDPLRHPGVLAAMSSAPLLPFPRTRSRTVPDVKNDHLVTHDFIHDQIFANRKS